MSVPPKPPRKKSRRLRPSPSFSNSFIFGSDCFKICARGSFRGLRFGIALFETERPFDPAEQMLLIRFAHLGRIFPLETRRCVRVPNVFTMAERSIKHSALAIFLAPGNEKFSRLLILGIFVQHQEFMDLRFVIAIDQII